VVVAGASIDLHVLGACRITAAGARGDRWISRAAITVKFGRASVRTETMRGVHQ